MNNNNGHGSKNNGPLTATMSETSDDSSLNSVDLDPMGKFCLFVRFFFVQKKGFKFEKKKFEFMERKKTKN